MASFHNINRFHAHLLTPLFAPLPTAARAFFVHGDRPLSADVTFPQPSVPADKFLSPSTLSRPTTRPKSVDT